MAITGQSLENPVTGVRIVFRRTARDTHGAAWENEFFVQPRQGREASAHVHMTSNERFEILAGTARYRLDGVEHEAQAGDLIDFPARKPHLHPWSTGDEVLHMRQVVEFPVPNEPALLAMESFFEQLYGLAQRGKVNASGLPNPVHMAVLAKSIQPEFYLAGMPIAVQNVLFGSLARIGRRLGY